MSMNIFRLAGDMSHVFSIIVLLLRVRVAKNVQGRWLTVDSWTQFRIDQNPTFAMRTVDRRTDVSRFDHGR